MQDRYVGDVGDFGKYALLRRLCSGEGNRLRVGVVWYKYGDEGHNGDGKHVAYLQNEKFASLDPPLHRTLGELVARGRRTIGHIERSGVLPEDTRYHAEPTTGQMGEGRVTTRRLAYRLAWLAQALKATTTADLIFLDPDNGVASPITRNGSSKSGKYVFLNEIAEFWKRGQSLVVYHHLNRTAPNTVQVAALENRIQDALCHPPLLYPLILRRGSCRVFWIAGQELHQAALRVGIAEFLSAGWTEHCTIPGASFGTRGLASDPPVRA